ncbi:uncharacterized protein LOC135131621 [Zophobas morio]|uniref:uncharacterized protein LOC135131621 n=1 Tax=Zophobas morio TaxID=2755281 RepID=UPI0030827047
MSVEILEAEMFSVEIDSTQDISTKEQCSVIIRYVYMGNIIERLFSLIRCTDTTGKGFEALVLNFRSSKFSCYSLKLVTLTPLEMSCDWSVQNYPDLESSVRFDPHSFELSVNLSGTLTTSFELAGNDKQELALKKIFGDFNKPENSLYVVVIDTLEKIEKNDKINPDDTRVTAKNHKDNLLKYENIITAQIFLKIFSITGPLSRYLQTRGLDLLKCNHMLETTIEQLRSIQRDFISIQEATNTFLRWAKLELESKDVDADIQEHFTNLKEELLSFASNWEKLKLTLEDTYKTNYDLDLHIIEDDYDNEDGIDTGAYCALATAYQYLLTLPITQVECERSFSVLKYIKNRLRNRLTDDRLESFVIMNVEKSILNTVDNEEVINSLAAESDKFGWLTVQSQPQWRLM